MRLARISNMHQPFPPKGYGGTQRSMSQMTYFQAMQGHDIVLYGPADSTIEHDMAIVAAKYGLRSVFASSERKVSLFDGDRKSGSVTFRTTGHNSVGYRDPDADARNEGLLNLLLDDCRTDHFDLIHCHSTFLMPALIAAGLKDKTICQLHNRDLEPDYRDAPYPVIAISKHQAGNLVGKFDADILGVAYHGLDRFNNTPSFTHAGYLASIGRFEKTKGQDLAVKAARRSKTPMIIAGTTQGTAAFEMYFNAEVRPYVDVVDEDFLTRHMFHGAEEIAADIAAIGRKIGRDHPVIFVGSASEDQKQVLYANAMATLFPIRWEEPFGRVMIESMACGTPVIANEFYGGGHCGSVAEVIDEGVTGYKISAADDDDCVNRMVAAMAKCAGIDRRRVHEVFEDKWTSEANADTLSRLYRDFMDRRDPAAATRIVPVAGPGVQP